MNQIKIVRDVISSVVVLASSSSFAMYDSEVQMRWPLHFYHFEIVEWLFVVSTCLLHHPSSGRNGYAGPIYLIQSNRQTLETRERNNCIGIRLFSLCFWCAHSRPFVWGSVEKIWTNCFEVAVSKRVRASANNLDHKKVLKLHIRTE